eukprot:Hpha_TRINITY_DN15903_c2_g1::TRINITY_DN15903_c2_g1_i1::g.73534::m.73534
MRRQRDEENARRLAALAGETARREAEAEERDKEMDRRAAEDAKKAAIELEEKLRCVQKQREAVKAEEERKQSEHEEGRAQERAVEQRRALLADRVDQRVARERAERVLMGIAERDSQAQERHIAEEARRVREMAAREREAHFRKKRAVLCEDELEARKRATEAWGESHEGLRVLQLRLNDSARAVVTERDAVGGEEGEERVYITGREVEERELLRVGEQRGAGSCQQLMEEVAELRSAETGARRTTAEEEKAVRAEFEIAAVHSSRHAAACEAASLAASSILSLPEPPRPPALLLCLDRKSQLTAHSNQRSAWLTWTAASRSATDGSPGIRRKREKGGPTTPPRSENDPPTQPGGSGEGGGAFDERKARGLSGADVSQLRRLRAPLENIRSICPPLDKLKKLHTLDLSGNAVSRVKGLNDMPLLQSLILRDNQLTSFDGCAEGCEELRVLDLSSNKIGELEGLSEIPIRKLLASGNCIRNIPGTKGLPASLTELELFRNNIQDISALAELPQLTSVNLGRNAVVDANFLSSSGGRGFPCLGAVHLDMNRIRAVPSRIDAVLLRELWLGGNCIERVPALGHCPLLRVLDLRENHITDASGVSTCVFLEYLDLSFNRIAENRDLLDPVLPLQSLHTLAINDNPVWQQDTTQLRGSLLAALPSLRELNSDAVEVNEKGKAEREHLFPLLADKLVRRCLNGSVAPLLPMFGGTPTWGEVRWGGLLEEGDSNQMRGLQSYASLCAVHLAEQRVASAIRQQELSATALRERKAEGEPNETRRLGSGHPGGPLDPSMPPPGCVAEAHAAQITALAHAQVAGHLTPGVGHMQNVWRPNQRYLQQREQYRRKTAATMLGRWARRVLCRRRLRQRRAERFARAARRIQPLWKGAVVRQRLARGMWVDEDPTLYTAVSADFAEEALAAHHRAPLPSAAMLLAEQLMRTGGLPPTPPQATRPVHSSAVRPSPCPPPPGTASTATSSAAAGSLPPPRVEAAWMEEVEEELEEEDEESASSAAAAAAPPLTGMDAVWAQGMHKRERKFELIKRRRQQNERKMGLLGRRDGLDQQTRDLHKKVGRASSNRTMDRRPSKASTAGPPPRDRSSTMQPRAVESDIDVRSVTSSVQSATSRDPRRAPPRLPPLGR